MQEVSKRHFVNFILSKPHKSTLLLIDTMNSWKKLQIRNRIETFSVRMLFLIFYCHYNSWCSWTSLLVALMSISPPWDQENSSSSERDFLRLQPWLPPASVHHQLVSAACSSSICMQPTIWRFWFVSSGKWPSSGALFHFMLRIHLEEGINIHGRLPSNTWYKHKTEQRRKVPPIKRNSESLMLRRDQHHYCD